MALHPDLARVMAQACQGPQGFQVTEIDPFTVEIVCLSQGRPDLTVAAETGGLYGRAAEQVFNAAKVMAVKVEWGQGGEDHWRRFQLNPRVYPHA